MHLARLPPGQSAGIGLGVGGGVGGVGAGVGAGTELSVPAVHVPQ